ncbi:hypothetical protein T440DRAFT_548885 [Plenodomus tracheiphilus IPT5]|uniref:Uncharacterized protein n=1 Tax=Plenodomus tracheiphilus IPT5 TaxID=1408161 RepID=A0A6A7BGB1_9PLEO|nr:hypothetical protein T440DRAFT_548885 [Plenodomus tracheiphilus IPT5]
MVISSPPQHPNTPPPTYFSHDRPPPYTISNSGSKPFSPLPSGLSSGDEDLEAARIRQPPPCRPARVHIAVYIPSRGDNERVPVYKAILPDSVLAAPPRRRRQVTLGRRVRVSDQDTRMACAVLLLILVIIVVLVVVLYKAKAMNGK